MKQLRLLVPVSDENFDEAAYLYANPDVARAVAKDLFASAYEHFDAFGRHEDRGQRQRIPQKWKAEKLARARASFHEAAPCRSSDRLLDCLTDELRHAFGADATDNVSAHEYDCRALDLIERHAGGWVLDCGAGLRNTYYAHVLNTEIVGYDSTDVVAVAERLPFKDGSFDAVLSLNVLEHVKDPFLAASELMRVLRPGGELFCVAPFLQPLHGYPHHYYNMSREGLLNLFGSLTDKRIDIYGAMQPIWALQWFLSSYRLGLPDALRSRFEAMTVAQLLDSPDRLELDAIATELGENARTELASAHALSGRKPID